MHLIKRIILMAMVLAIPLIFAEAASRQGETKQKYPSRATKPVRNVPDSAGVHALESGEQNDKQNEAARTRWEIRTAPLALLARWYTLEGLFHITEQLAVGPSFVRYGSAPIGNMFIYSYRGRSIGIVGTYYFQPQPSTWYTSVRYYHEDYTFYPHAKDYNHHYNGHALMAVAGYRMPIVSAIFLMFGGGLQLGMYERVETKTNSATGVVAVSRDSNRIRFVPYIEGKVGLSF